MYKQRARLNVRKYLFSHQVVNSWNGLPDYVVNADTILKYEQKLDKFWKNQDQKSNFKVQIVSTTTQRLESNVDLELEA